MKNSGNSGYRLQKPGTASPPLVVTIDAPSYRTIQDWPLTSVHINADNVEELLANPETFKAVSAVIYAAAEHLKNEGKGAVLKHYRLRAASGRYGVKGAIRRRNVPMPTGWRWYALQTEPGSEFAVQRRLHAASFETFLPLLHMKQKGESNRFLVGRPRLPGYLFIGFSTPTIPWAEVLAVKGVSSVLANNGEPLAFTPMEMHRLVLAAQRPRRVLGGAAKVRTKNKKGDGSNQILSGPYAGSMVRVIDTDEGEALYAFDTRKYRLNAEPANYSVNGRRLK